MCGGQIVPAKGAEGHQGKPKGFCLGNVSSAGQGGCSLLS